MKIVAVFALLNFLAFANCIGQKSKLLAIANFLENVALPFREECIKETSVDMVVLHNFEKSAEVPNNRNLKCYLRCLYIRTNIVDETGIINIENLRQAVKTTNNEFMDRLEKDCKHPKQTDPCEAAFDSATCGLGLLNEYHLIN